MVYYRRHLPHWQPQNASLFVTWRLYGSLPSSVVLPTSYSTSSGKAFLAFDRELDRAATGPTWLKNPRLAQLVVDALRFGADQRKYYQLHSFVVMSNHVHILVSPTVRLSTIPKAIKGFTAREANKILKRTGKTFWQDECFYRFCRFFKILTNDAERNSGKVRPDKSRASSCVIAPQLIARRK